MKIQTKTNYLKRTVNVLFITLIGFISNKNKGVNNIAENKALLLYK